MATTRREPTRRGLAGAIGLVVLLVAAASGGEPLVSKLKKDEQIYFRSTYGYADPAGGWRLVASGVVYETRGGAGMLTQLAELFGLPAEAAESGLFRERIGYFLVDHERGKQIVLRIGPRDWPFEPTAKDGVFLGELHVAGLGELGLADDVIDVPVVAVLAEPDTRQFAGAIRLIGPRGWTVISDIDDTVKVTEVNDREAVMANTFLRPFRAVAGMPELLQSWARQGAVFHYVSASPTQLDAPLTAFLSEAGLPRGTVHLRRFHLGGSKFLQVGQPHDEFKHEVITQILRHFPERRFILVGDSGQHDPEIYGRLARENPRQVRRVFIRNVSGEAGDAPRYAEAFRELPPATWRVFDEPSGLALDLSRLE